MNVIMLSLLHVEWRVHPPSYPASSRPSLSNRYPAPTVSLLCPSCVPPVISLIPLPRSQRDTDGDGEISLDEFKTFMTAMEMSGMQSGVSDVADTAAVRVFCDMSLWKDSVCVHVDDVLCVFGGEGVNVWGGHEWHKNKKGLSNSCPPPPPRARPAPRPPFTPVSAHRFQFAASCGFWACICCLPTLGLSCVILKCCVQCKVDRLAKNLENNVLLAKQNTAQDGPTE
jgi:hypothetical protein